jgi:hypothetical protein
MANTFTNTLKEYSPSSGSTPKMLIGTNWAEYPMVIGATTTAPTKGTTVRDKAMWRRVGDTLEMRFDYQQSGAGSAGSGTYLFPLPAGLSIDPNKIALGAAPAIASSVGTGSCSTSADFSTSGRELTMAAYDANNLMAYIDLNGTFSMVNSGGNELANANQTYSFTAAVPIVGWDD